MLSPAQERLIRWLGRFPRELSQAWDVPRDISLPGLSEAMGVVRSALHAPLKELVNLGIFETRLAHVTGGGARRRNVYHLTGDGWNLLAKLPEDENPAGSAAKRGNLSGGAPACNPIVGREDIVNNIIQSITESGNAIVTGLPGIGKTSLLRAVAEELIDSGKNVAWARCTQFDDISALLSGAFDSGNPPSSPDAILAWLRRKIGKGVLVIDELQEIHPRHSDTVIKLLRDVLEGGPSLVLGCRAPSPIESEQTFQIGELDEESALSLLGEGVDSELGSEVVAALGGHPLALKLHDAETDLTNVGSDISEYIEKTVFDSLPDDCLEGLDELACMPLPVGPERLQNVDSIGVLDDYALLRWADEDSSAVELQHLVRYVRREMWDEEKLRRIHALAAEHWSEHPESQARFVEFHHRLAAEDPDVSAFITLHAEDLGNCDDGALAALLHDGIQKRPEVDALWHLATKTALDRGERDVVEDLLDRMPNSNSGDALVLRARNALQLGNTQEAEKLQNEAASSSSPEERIRITISQMTRILEDRLPNGQPSLSFEDIKSKLNELKLSEIDSETRQRSLVAIATIKHSIALLEKDYSTAKKIRDQLADLTEKSDPLLYEMNLRAAVDEAEWGSPDWHRESEEMRRLMESVMPMRALSMRLQLVEIMAPNDSEEAGKLLEDREEIALSGPTARRLIAKIWYWRGVLEGSKSIECWREAIHRYRSAECVHAAQELTHKMHGMLR